MAGCRVYDDSHLTNVLIKNERLPCSSEVLDSLWAPNSSPSFHGSASMVNFESENKTEMPLTKLDSKLDNCNEDFDGCFHQPEKKRRLSPDQVQFLEKSFELENKLEPERKIRLAKQLGLQPRQVTIWFQNRRARYRTKQLEKDYDVLKASFDKLKQDCDVISKDNDKLKNEVQFLTEKLLEREKGKISKQEQCEPISPTMELQTKNPISASSAKSDVFDSDSPHYGPHYINGALLEPADSSRVVETEASDFSQDEDDSLSRSFLLPPPSVSPKIEDECCDELQPNSCGFGFPVQDQGTWFWQY